MSSTAGAQPRAATVKQAAATAEDSRVEPEPDVARELRRMVRLNRQTFPLGTAACTVTLTALARPYVDGGVLAAWTAAGLASAVFFALALWPPLERRHDADGLPALLPAAGYWCGLVFGVLPWLDLDALRRTPFQWIALVILMAMTSGTQSGLINGTKHLVRVTVPAWTLAGAAYLVVGHRTVAAAAVVYLAIVVRDAVTSRRFVIAGVEARVHAHRQAVTDPLTGLPNRAGVLAVLDRLAASSGEGEVVVLYVDLDGFKDVNDTHGHLAGDALLVEASRRLAGCLRPQDVVGRLGGDEFLAVLVMPGPAGRVTDVDALCARGLAALEEPFAVDGVHVRLSASVGVASGPAGGFVTDDLLRRADAALYTAKRTGRGRAVRDAGLTEEPRP